WLTAAALPRYRRESQLAERRVAPGPLRRAAAALLSWVAVAPADWPERTSVTANSRAKATAWHRHERQPPSAGSPRYAPNAPLRHQTRRRRIGAYSNLRPRGAVAPANRRALRDLPNGPWKMALAHHRRAAGLVENDNLRRRQPVAKPPRWGGSRRWRAAPKQNPTHYDETRARNSSEVAIVLQSY